MNPMDNRSENSNIDHHHNSSSLDDLSESLAGLSVGSYGKNQSSVINDSGHAGNLSVLGEGLELDWGATGTEVNTSNFNHRQQNHRQKYGGITSDDSGNKDRRRGESIDLFLSRSPSQTLGSDLLKLHKDGLDAIPHLNIGNGVDVSNQQQPQVVPPAETNVHGRSQGNGRDMSPSCSVTGTSGSSRSTSPSWNTNADGSRRSGVGIGKTILAYQQQQQSMHPPPGLGGINFDANRQYNQAQEFSLPHPHSSLKPRQDSSSFVSAMAARNTYPDLPPYDQQQTNPSIGPNHISTQKPSLTQTQPFISLPSSDNVMIGHQQQPHDPKPQQVFYMAVPTPDGQGQVLQPVQMVQLPGQPNAFMLPASGSAQYQPQQQDMGGMAPLQNSYIASHPSTGGYMPERNGRQVKQLHQHQYGYVGSPRNGNVGVSRVKNYTQMQNVRAQGQIRSSFNSESGFSESSSYVYGSSDDPYTSHVDTQVYGDLGSQHRDSIRKDVLTNNEIVANLYASPKRPPLRELLGHVRRLSRDQVGCRLLQQALDEEGGTAATAILNEGLSFWGEAMVDPFGNYLFQKILEKINSKERVVLIKTVSPRLVNASLNLHGTRSVQKVVELCAIDEIVCDEDVNGNCDNHESEQFPKETAAEILTRSLTPAAARLCIDSHGNHVIQRILLKLPYKYSQFVFEAVANSVGDVARHRHGCCVIQRCLDSPPSIARSNLVLKIVEKSLELMQDAYGNYVVQYVLDVCSDEDVHSVCESVVGKVSLLAIQKFSSNVMEKCLERCTDRVRESYLEELSEHERIRELMMDPFGNYVIQRALAVASHNQALKLVDSMRPHLMTANGGGIRNTAGGRRILAKIERRFPHFNINEEGSIERAIHRKGSMRHDTQATINPPQRGVNRRGQKKAGGREPQPQYPQYRDISHEHDNGTNYFMMSGDKLNYDHM